MKSKVGQNPKRMLALDVMRGITVALMILVNNPGTWEHIYAPLRHAQWNGLTPTDLVFPFFMFIMGISTAFSLRRYDFRIQGTLTRKILFRSLLIFIIGILIDRFSALCWGVAVDSWSRGIAAAFDSSKNGFSPLSDSFCNHMLACRLSAIST